MNITRDSVHIREVWKDNLHDEILLIREVVDRYPFVAMDTEFPGFVIEPLRKNFTIRSEFNYQKLKENVNLLKLIQLGLTFSDCQGNLPTCETDKYCVWQFNFCDFDIDEDFFAKDSTDLLIKSGITFQTFREKGVSAVDFGELLVSSGVVMNEEVHWIVFHGGCDFGYLIKLLTGKALPDTQEEFFELLGMFFPKVYDIKHIIKFYNLYGGLDKLAEILGVERVGNSHLAGSDSLLTCCIFRRMMETVFQGLPEMHAGVVFDLGVEYAQVTGRQ